jgi:hypothetical protein
VGDDELVEADPGEQTLIRRARKKMEDTKLIEHIVRWAVIAAIGAGSSVATRQVKDAGHETVVQENREGVLELRGDIKLIRDGFAQRVEVEEHEREDALKKLEHRLTRIETLLEVRMGVAPMPAAAPPN